MPKLCCFFCPAKDFSERSFDDLCPTCKRPLGFPLQNAPTTIADFRVVRALSRGFYAATYVVESGKLNTPYVLKVVSKAVYAYFGKKFEQECRDHRRVAEGTEHVVQINDMLDASINFGNVALDCHVAVLNYIKGDPLGDLLKDSKGLGAQTVAQIGIDLFRLLGELRGKVTFHNDLHGGNILIQRETARVDAIDPSVRAVAVDLGSISDESKSSSDTLQRLGDIQWVASHLLGLVDHLLREPDKTTDLDYRLASKLEDIAHRLSPSSESSRTPSMTELAEEIMSACHHVPSPWREPFKLRKFNDSYNAQTLAPWYVPLLLVDPDEQWLGRMSTPGPQIITGMRGCGKTLFLRALQFHARAATRDTEKTDAVLGRLKDDRFIGLYVSASRLLDTLGERSRSLHKPYARLYAAYALEAIRAVQHLQEISHSAVAPSHQRILATAIGDYLRGRDIQLEDSASIQQLENTLIRALVSLSRGETSFTLSANPAVAFPHLAEAIQKCSPLWTGASVLFLLDDVSTRYLHEPKIKELLSALQFQSPFCAFKITSEAQTLSLRSPGQIALARIGRDYDLFDLGAEVYKRISKRSRNNASDHGKTFVEQILKRRAKYYFNHPIAPPSSLLGDVSLEKIAENIASTAKTSKRKKEVYQGITALTRVCVGDIGDVITLYELILQRAQGRRPPIPAAIQSECYQEFCSRRLYDLNRRKGELKDVALSFAQASHELLLASYRDRANGQTSRQRLRQYMSIYVRITKGNIKWQYDKLRDLIDSGLFVFAGGSDTPRTKTPDANPIQQFKLTYRKMYGLSNFIGLAEGDRFELSGKQLEDWLRYPSKGREILLRNRGENDSDLDESEDGDDSDVDSKRSSRPIVEDPAQGELFETTKVIQDIFPSPDAELDTQTQKWLEQYIPPVRKHSLAEVAKVKFDTLILGLGFESRAATSAQRLCKSIRPKEAILIRYKEKGKTDQIKRAVRATGAKVRILDYEDVKGLTSSLKSGNVMIDVTGLAKPFLFHSVREALRKNGRVWICHTRAASYYPLDHDISTVLRAERTRDHHALLSSLGKILTGEKGPYKLERLHSSEVDVSRRRVLFTFASAKHERLLGLLEHRDYDQVEIVVPMRSSPRAQIARIAADVAVKSANNARLTEVHSNDLIGILTLLVRKYQHWYVERGFNFDVALTGSKIHAVACAVISVALKVSDSLYLSPSAFDKDRFTKGVKSTSVYSIRLR